MPFHLQLGEISQYKKFYDAVDPTVPGTVCSDLALQKCLRSASVRKRGELYFNRHGASSAALLPFTIDPNGMLGPTAQNFIFGIPTEDDFP
eukprot:scaffold181393_cov33-Attheya_sp.AAC.2